MSGIFKINKSTVGGKPSISEVKSGEGDNDLRRQIMVRAATKKKVELEGFLNKQNPHRSTKSTRRRWFCLRGRELAYYSKPDDPKPLGIINLAEVQRVHGLKQRSALCFAIDTAGRQYILYASSKDEVKYWLHGLNKALASNRKPNNAFANPLPLSTSSATINNIQILQAPTTPAPPPPSSPKLQKAASTTSSSTTSSANIPQSRETRSNSEFTGPVGPLIVDSLEKENEKKRSPRFVPSPLKDLAPPVPDNTTQVPARRAAPSPPSPTLATGGSAGATQWRGSGVIASTTLTFQRTRSDSAGIKPEKQTDHHPVGRMGLSPRTSPTSSAASSAANSPPRSPPIKRRSYQQVEVDMDMLRIKMEELERIEEMLLQFKKQQCENEREEMKMLLLGIEKKHRNKEESDANTTRTNFLRKERELEREIRQLEGRMEELNHDLQLGINKQFDWDTFETNQKPKAK